MKKIDWKHYDMESHAKVPNIRLPKNIDTVQDLEEFLLDIYVMEDYMDSEMDFVAIYNHLFTIFVNCYPIADLRNYLIKFKLYHSNKNTYSLPFKKFILAAPIMGALQLIWKDANIDQSFIMTDYDSKIFNDMMDDVNYLLTSYNIPIDVRSTIIADTYYRYTQLSYTLADIINPSLSMEDYIIPYIMDDEFKRIVDTPIDESLQPVEVKQEILNRSATLKKIYQSVTYNGIGIIISSKSKINERQFQEMNISYGQIPNVYGVLIMHIIKNNGFNKGLETPGDYYLAQTVSRYAAIINNNDMGDVGYFFRNVSILCGTVSLSKTIHDCHTNHLLRYTVDDIRFIEGKYYKDSLDDKTFKVVSRKDKHLMGKTIYLRSAIFCACGDEICHVCYGEDHRNMMDLPGMGIYNSQVITNPVYQGILSVKHAIDGQVQTITTNDNFKKYFKITENYIDTSDEIDAEDYTLLIEQQLLDEMDYRSENFGLVSDPYIYVGDHKTVQKCEIQNIQDITYNTAIIKAVKLSKKYKGYYEVPLSILEDEGSITVTLVNYGVSDVLKDFKRLIKYDSSKYSIYDYLHEIIGIVRRAKIRAKLIQIEILMNRLVRDPNDVARRPNYTNDIVDECIVPINKSLLTYNGVPVRLSFEQTKRQLQSYTMYDKYGDAYTQPLFELYYYNDQNK